MDRTPAPELRIGGAALDRQLLSDQIHGLLQAKISSGELPPGTPLVESRIARQLGVSQSPVRDALRRLAHEGLALRFPRRGTFVAEISIEDAYAAYQVRAALEQLAATEVARQANEETLQALADEVEGMLIAAKREDVHSFVEHDIAFHRRIWQAAGNDMLMRIWPMVEPSLRHLTVVFDRVYFSHLEPLARSHQDLLDALRRRDGKAGELFRRYILSVWDDINKA